MKQSLKTGLSFGSTSGIITTLGLIVGLHSGTHSKTAIIGGVLTIAIADAFSDALGIHISEESENRASKKEIWESTILTFISKFFFASLFLIPILLLDLLTAIAVSIAWGLTIVGVLSFIIAKGQNPKPWNVVFEHVAIAVIVIIATHLVGDWIGNTFGVS